MVTKKLPTPRKTPTRGLNKPYTFTIPAMQGIQKKSRNKKLPLGAIDVSKPIATIHVFDGSFFVEMNDESLSVAKILTMIVSTVPMAIRDIIQRRVPDNNEVIERMLTRASAHTLRTGRTF